MADAPAPPPKRKRSRYFAYRAFIAALMGGGTVWLSLSVLISVGVAVYGAQGGGSAGGERIEYVRDGDNRKALRLCASSLRRQFQELRDRIDGVAAEPVGSSAGKRWLQWMAHYRGRLEALRFRCRIEPDADDLGDDPLLAELHDAAAALARLTHDYERVHLRVVDSFDAEFVTMEGALARIDARLVTAAK